MKKKIIERYDVSDNGEVIIKISAKKVEDLYNEYDKKSSFSKKDLDQELVEYIIESVNEIGKEPFSLKFYLEDQIPKGLQEKVRNSIKLYFSYLQDLEKKKMKEQVKNSFIFIIIGLFFTTCSLLSGDSESFIVKILSEGMLVAGWVSLWEALATLLIKWLPLTKKLKTFTRVFNCDVEFA
ncbi:MAG: hypothetical protein K8R39_10035 [Arcobacteraceae bacterium]|nr:hypothetical protein [Arcobacteraceae bacterium]